MFCSGPAAVVTGDGTVVILGVAVVARAYVPALTVILVCGLIGCLTRVFADAVIVHGGITVISVGADCLFEVVARLCLIPIAAGIAFKGNLNLDTVFIMMSAYGDRDTAISAIKHGAYDYISKPFKKDEVLFTDAGWNRIE